MAWQAGGWAGNAWGQQQATQQPQWQATQQPHLSPAAWSPAAAAVRGTSMGGAGAAVMSGTAGDTLVVSTGGQDMDEVVVRTLVGEYTTSGTNQGRKVYKKAAGQPGAADAVEVFIYYWDARDGDAFEGWWFGNQLGGTQVWSHVKNSDMTPPSTGWKIPWDGAVRSSLSLQSKAVAAQGAAANMRLLTPSSGDVSNRVKIIADELAAVEASAQMALEQARGLAGDLSSTEGINQAEQLLTPAIGSLAQAGKQLMASQRGATGEELKELAALGQKFRVTHATVNTEMGKLLFKLKAAKMKAERDEKARQFEEKELTLFQDSLTETVAKTNAAEDSVEKALITAEMITSGGDDLEEVKAAVDQTEKIAREAQTAIGEARIFLNGKLASVKQFQSETVRKNAAGELMKLQAQLQAAQTKLTPLKTARQDFIQQTAAKKLSVELQDKLNPAEVEVDKAEEAMQLLLAEEASKEMLHQAEVAVSKANDHINAAMKFIELKKRAMPAQGVVREVIEKIEQRAQISLTKLQNMRNRQKEAIEKISSSTLTEEAAEKLSAVSDAVDKAEDAEQPFLMGLEELPLDETMVVVKACETAATTASTCVSIARMFIATKLVEVKRFTAVCGKEATETLLQQQKQLEAFTKRLTDFKRNTAKRKNGALVRESEVCVAKAEELAKKVAEAAAAFKDDSTLMELSSEELREAGTATATAEVAANTGLSEARKFITARQIEAKGKDSSEEVSALLIKYQTRLSTAQSEVSKYKKLSATVEQRLAAKKAVEDAVSKVVAAEEKVNAASKEATELTDMSPEGVGEKGYQDAVKSTESAYNSAATSLKQVERYLSSQTRVSGPAKEEMSKLGRRIKEAQQKLDEAAAAMKEQSEKLLVDTILSESEKRVSDAETAVNTAKKAEKPFSEEAELAGEELATAVAALDAGVAAAHSAVGGTKTFLAMKRLAAKRLGEAQAKSTSEELAKLQVRLDEVTKKLQEIRKGISERKAGQVKKLMLAKVLAVEKKVEEAGEATKALESLEASGDFSAGKAKAECEKLSSLDKEAQILMDDALGFLVENQKNAKSSEEEAKDLQSRLTAAQAVLAKSKSALGDFEQRFVATKLLSEANSMVSKLEEEFEKVKASCTPLLEEGGASFLASTTVVVIAEALKEHLAKTNGTKEALFKEAGGESGKIAKDVFLAFLDKLPEKLGSEELAFPEDQREGIFSHIDADKDEYITIEDFEGMFKIRYMCTTAISITDGFEIAKSKTVVKLELDDLVEILGDPRQLPNGVTRIECRTLAGGKLEGGKQGWVTMKGNQGTVYLDLHSPYNSFQKSTERLIEAVNKSVGKANSFVKAKTSALANTPRGPLADARTELTNLKPKVLVVQRDVDALKTEIANAKKDYIRKQEMVVEAKDRKAAAMLMKGIKDKVEAMEAGAQKLMDITKPLTAASGEELVAMATPLTISADAEKAIEALIKDCIAVREGIAEQKEIVAKAPKGPMREAKQELAKYMVKADATERKCASTSEAVRKACQSIATARFATASAGLRAEMQKKTVDVEAYFSELAKGQERISEEAFCTYLRSLEGLAFPDEHLKLLTQHIEADGIGRRNFENMIQRFYQCVKPIAVTNEFAISKSKTVRMLEMNEVIEVVEGPTADPKLGIQRVKGKAVSDGATGWISMKGNQGTPFLREIQKPCYCCLEDVSLDKEFRNANGDAPLKTLQAHEVLEVIEGPRNDCFEGAFRSKARACKDGAVGWFVATTKEGVVNTEQNGKYYVCTASIAMTDVADIKGCKVIRKLEKNEVAQVLEEPADQADVHRIKCKSMKDGQEGWITTKGNKGTVYAEETTMLFTLVNEVALNKSFESDVAVLVRQLAKGEAVEVIDGPKQEKFDVSRLKGRAFSDGAIGWVTVKASTMKPWSSQYKCVAEAELSPDLKQGGEKIRKIEVGEVIEVQDGPKKDGAVLRIKARAEKDGAVGWLTLKSDEGIHFFKQHSKVAERERR